MLLAACLLVASGVVQGSRAAGFDARYSVAATGLEIGRAALSLERADHELRLGFAFENGALLGLMEPSLTRMQSAILASGRSLTPQRYAALFRKEDREREISLSYAADGSPATFRLVKRGRVRLESVPEGLAGATDPLAALLRARAWLEQAVEGATLSLAVFDGRRRYEAELRYLGPMQATLAGEARAAHHLTIRYRQVAELDEDEGTWREDDDGSERVLDALMSADGRYLPLRLSGSFDGLPLTAQLDAECPAPPGCPPEP